MIKFSEACELAKSVMLKKGYEEGFLEIREADDKWFFVGSFEKERPFGNLPIAVDRENGNCTVFKMFAPGNFTIYTSAKELVIPKEYKCKAS